jgi:hypothetical protein
MKTLRLADKLFCQPADNDPDRKPWRVILPWWKRWAFRIVARHLMKADCSYQVAGRTNWGFGAWDEAKKRYRWSDIQTPGVAMAHWILHEAGYSVSEVGVVEWFTGEKYDSKKHDHFWHY